MLLDPRAKAAPQDRLGPRVQRGLLARQVILGQLDRPVRLVPQARLVQRALLGNSELPVQQVARVRQALQAQRAQVVRQDQLAAPG